MESDAQAPLLPSTLGQLMPFTSLSHRFPLCNDVILPDILRITRELIDGDHVNHL